MVRAGGGATEKSGEDVQLPCAVTQLGTSLPNVQVNNLVVAVSASIRIVS